MVSDQFGLTLKYPSSETNPQYFAFPSVYHATENVQVIGTNVATSGTFSGFTVADSNNIIVWEYIPDDGDDADLFIIPSSMSIVSNGTVSLDVNCDMNHEEAASRGYVNNFEEWQNVEITSHFFVKSVNKSSGYVYLEARNGYNGNKGGCCQGTAYGVRLFWDQGSDKGKFAFYKKEFTGSIDELPKQAQSTINTFYQNLFAVKFVIYNINESRVKLELWLTPALWTPFQGHSLSNLWTKVGEVEDFVGKGWNNGGEECDAIDDDAPLTWAAPFVAMGWKDGKVIQFNFTSFREIDINGSFGEDPIPPEEPPTFPDPNLPDPDPNPPTTPDPQPPDAQPPALPSTITRRLTMRREIINNTECKCDGILPAPPPEEPGGGGTTPPEEPGGTLTQIYNVPLNTSAFGRLAKVSGNTSYYLRYGQACTRTSSNWLGKPINRVEVTIAKQGNPTNSTTTGGVRCRIRKASEDALIELAPVVSETQITTAGTVLIFENLTNTYQMVLNDKIMFEYDGGDINNFIKIFRVEESSQSGTKVMFQNNAQDPGEYGDVPNLDVCARIWTLTP